MRASGSGLEPSSATPVSSSAHATASTALSVTRVRSSIQPTRIPDAAIAIVLAEALGARDDEEARGLAEVRRLILGEELRGDEHGQWSTSPACPAPP